MIPLSILDLSPIIKGGSASDSLRNSLNLAQYAEQCGFNRYWVAEHHGMVGIASAATSVVIGHIAGGTSSIRVGAGGIMLPNHAPLVIAEQFGTLEALYPGRIDLGLGRAPGTDPATSRALRRNLNVNVEQFPRDVLELINYFGSDAAGESVRAVPGQGMSVPVWILGSSLFGAQLAAHMGLPYAFASHFSPGQLMAAIKVYREQFKPSELLAEPYVMPGISVFAAEREEDARLLASSWQQTFINLYSGRPSQLQPPVADYFDSLESFQQHMLNDVMACSMVGTPDQVRQQMEDFIEKTGADELIIAAQIYDHEARIRSYEIVADVMMGRV
ncbi:MAG: LLM class flavin-dependent oxidoreductase [Porticoccaceae bacterium]|nr:LLM class flavin-dependent oxidoreductase [Porticoccaceae bacterium]